MKYMFSVRKWNGRFHSEIEMYIFSLKIEYTSLVRKQHVRKHPLIPLPYLISLPEVLINGTVTNGGNSHAFPLLHGRKHPFCQKWFCGSYRLEGLQLQRFIQLFHEIHLIFLSLSSFLNILVTNGLTKKIPMYHIQVNNNKWKFNSSIWFLRRPLYITTFSYAHISQYEQG